MAKEKTEPRVAPVNDGLAAKVRWQGKAISVILGVLKASVGASVIKGVERKLGVDLDGDGKAGHARFGALMALIVLVSIGGAYGKSLFELADSSAKHGTFKVVSDDAGAATLTVDAIVASDAASATVTNVFGGVTNEIVVVSGIVTAVNTL